MTCLHLQADAGVEDVSFSESFVALMLERYTSPGDVVLDPFVGFGTTMVVAERLGREAYGIEVLAERAELVRGRVAHPERVVHADVRSIEAEVLPAARFSLSSPPYMTRLEHPQNPLTGYATLDGDYDTYLRELTDVYVRVAATMAPGARLAVNVANIRTTSGITFLAWDVGRSLGEFLELEEELTISWDRPDPAITHDYCFVFVAS
jgi:hypothetical protein